MSKSRLIFLPLLCALMMLAGCSEYSNVLKSNDYEYKYEAAKSYYSDGDYRKAAEAFRDVLAILKGSQYGDECLFMLGMSNFRLGDFESATDFFKKYYLEPVLLCHVSL